MNNETVQIEVPSQELIDRAEDTLRACASEGSVPGLQILTIDFWRARAIYLAERIVRGVATPSPLAATERTYIAGLQRAWAIVNGRKAGRDASDEIWRELTKIEHIIEQEESYSAPVSATATTGKKS